MEVPLERISRDHFIYAFAPGLEPVCEVAPGGQILFETLDASTGRIHHANDLEQYLAVRDRRRVNPATGPVRVVGSRTGDELVVTIERIDLAPRGYVRVGPGSALVDRIDEHQAVIVPIEGGHFLMGGHRFPIRPMVGVIGTAPARGELLTAVPGDHGSNLDCNAIRPGARVHLPVAVEGALLALGDVHASMGDAEISGTGIEIGAEVQVRVESLFCGSHGFPWVESDERIIAIGHGPTIDAALTTATARLVQLLGEQYGFGRIAATMAISAAGDVRVGQYCGGMDATAYATFPRPRPD